ncbi:MAG: hypothetical protein ACXQTP_01580 [Candidatus Methanofastidiosia archaeon]
MFFINKNLLSPKTFVFLYAVFIFTGIVSNYVMDDLGYAFSWVFFFYVCAGMLFFLIGTRFEIKISPRFLFPVFLFLSILFSFKEVEYLSFAGVVFLYIIYAKLDLVTRKGEMAVVVGLIILLLNLFYVGFIPLFSPELRYTAQNIYFVFGYSLVFIGVNFLFLEKKSVLLLCTILSFCMLLFYGYRTYLIILVLSMAINAAFREKLKLKTALAFGGFVLLVVLALGYFTTMRLSQEWHLSILSLPFYRIGFTVHMLDEACRAAGMWGLFHGRIWLFPATAEMVGAVVAGSGNITTTLLGPLILDGGLIELPLMIFAGASMNTLYRQATELDYFVPYYSIAMAILLVSIEISPIPLIFLMFLLAVILSNRKYNKREFEHYNGETHGK